MLRGSRTGGPSPLARLVALILLIGMIGISAPVLIRIVAWIVALL